MGFYPIVLELAARPVLVIGGGAVAERKVDGGELRRLVAGDRRAEAIAHLRGKLGAPACT